MATTRSAGSRPRRSAAAKTGNVAPTQEYLIRHLLESFLDRLTRTEHAADFVLKGGILLAAYGVRRPTKDADANAVNADVSAEHVADVVRDIAAVQVADGVVFDVGSIDVQEIREQSDYPGLRVRVRATIGPWRGTAAWDVSTGDPIVPAPRAVTIARVLGDPIVLLCYAPETTIAEKGVTILEHGVTSTRWRDYVESSSWHVRASTQTNCWGLRTRFHGTAASPWSRSHRTSRGTARSDRRNGRHGVARKGLRLSRKKTWMTRSASWPLCWIRSSLSTRSSGGNENLLVQPATNRCEGPTWLVRSLVGLTLKAMRRRTSSEPLARDTPSVEASGEVEHRGQPHFGSARALAPAQVVA